MKAKFIYESILNELSATSTLYHRSMKKMKVGDKIIPKFDEQGTHWLAKDKFEIAMEEYRKQNFLDKPSRLNCIFSSVIPRSRFIDKGYLYVIKPIGNYFMTNSNIIDETAEKFDREYGDNVYFIRDEEYRKKLEADFKENPQKLLRFLDRWEAERYWKGDVKYYTDMKDIEVLSDSAIVTEVIEEERIRVNDDYVVTENGKITVDLSVYLSKNFIEKFKKNNKTQVDLINKFKNLFSSLLVDELTQYKDFGQDGYYKFEGELKKGVKFKVWTVRSPLYRKKYRDYEEEREIARKSGTKYEDILMGLYDGKEILTRGEENKYKNIGMQGYRMEYRSGYAPKVRDISKYLKKVN